MAGRAAWSRILRNAALAGTLVLTASGAFAQGGNGRLHEFGPFIVDPARPTLIFLVDAIEQTAVLDFRRAAAAFPDADTLVLDSGGGGVSNALAIADEIADTGFSTVIPSWGGCYSACAFIFFAGPERVAYGELGVHQVSAGAPDLDAAQRVMADIFEMLGKFETPTAVISALLRTPPEEIYVFSQAELEGSRINRGSVDDPAPLDPALAEAAAAAAAAAAPPPAQKPNGTLAPRYGSASLRAGFTPDPYSFYLSAGGPIDVTTLGGECVGFVAEAPDFRLSYEAAERPLFISALSTTDTTLAVMGPDRVWLCDDDDGPGLNPLLRIDRPLSGQYDIWIGVIERSAVAPNAQLQVSETGVGQAPAVITPPADAPAAEPAGGQSTTIAVYRDWAVIVNPNWCSAVTTSIDVIPNTESLTDAALVVTVLRSPNPRPELGFVYQFTLDEGYFISVSVDGGRIYDLVPTTNNRIGEAETTADHEALMRAFRAGIEVAALAVPLSGPERIDTFSLLGITAATQRAIDECRQ